MCHIWFFWVHYIVFMTNHPLLNISNKKKKIVTFIYKKRRCLRGVMADEIGCDIVVNKFKLRSRYHVQFRNTTLRRRSFFQAAVVSILLYGCTTYTLINRLEKKLDSNYTGMLQAILNKSCRQHPTRHQLYGHLSPITKSVQVRRTRHSGHC